MRVLKHLLAGPGLLTLAACSGGPQFTDLPTNLMAFWPARQAIEEARAATSPADPFKSALRTEYLRHADYEFGPMQDYVDAAHHGRKALAAARGEMVEPDQPGTRMLPPTSQGELTSAYTRLSAVLEASGRAKAPEATARAQAAYDCWLEQQEEDFQPDDIASCRRIFEQAIAEAEAAVKAQPMPAVIVLEGDVLFEFDKAVIRPEFEPELDRIAALLRDHPEVRVYVDGHTDTAGPAAYNMRLSERRAQAVADALAARGVARERMEVRAFGETQLAVPTPDNTPEAKNRRVEIRRR